MKTIVSVLIMMIFSYTLSAGDFTREYDVKPFSALEISSAFNVKLVKAETYKVLVEMEENEFEHLEIRVRDKTLHISSDFRSLSGLMADIVIYVPEVLTSVDLSGAVRLNAGGLEIKCKEFELEVRGASSFYNGNIEAIEGYFEVSDASLVDKMDIEIENLELDVNGTSSIKMKTVGAENIIVDVSGVSGVELWGDAKNVDFEARGVSTINAVNLDADYAKIVASGVSSISATIIKETSLVKSSGLSVLEIHRES